MGYLGELTNVALVVTAALGCGLLLEAVRQPAVLGYILAGVLLGPSWLAYIQDRDTVNQLAELGVLLLLFLVGIELNLRSFKRVWLVSLGATAFQVAGGVLFSYIFSICVGLSWKFSLFLGFLISLSSTAVAVKMLENTGELKSDTGRLVLGILVAQDLAIVPMMIVLRSFQQGFLWKSFCIQILSSVSCLMLLVWYLSRRQRVHIPFSGLFSESDDLAPMVGLAFCFGFATISGFFGLSAAYGAFLAGLILGNSGERGLMLETMTPIYSVFMMVFFLSVGLLLDLRFLYENCMVIILLLLVVTVGKTFFNVSVLHFLKRPWTQSFLAGVVLAQIGEFSFVLASMGREGALINEYQRQLIISLTALSLSFGPLWLFIARRLHGSLKKEIKGSVSSKNMVCSKIDKSV